MSQPSTDAVARVLGVSIDALDMAGALQRIVKMLRERQKGYVCLTGVHGVMEAQKHPDLSAILKESALTLPDGAPTAWVGRWQGHQSMRRVAGPDLMIEIFRRREFAGCTHFLYGGQEGVAEELRKRLEERFPSARVLGTYTPPFRELNAEEERVFVNLIHGLRPDIVWVGISTPKQERFMHRYLNRLDTVLMFGVGAAFDFHTGRIKDAPQWVKTIGMQWLHRLLQDPERLWKRYLRNNSRFLWLMALQFFGLGKRPAMLLHKPTP